MVGRVGLPDCVRLVGSRPCAGVQLVYKVVLSVLMVEPGRCAHSRVDHTASRDIAQPLKAKGKHDYGYCAELIRQALWSLSSVYGNSEEILKVAERYLSENRSSERLMILIFLWLGSERMKMTIDDDSALRLRCHCIPSGIESARPASFECWQAYARGCVPQTSKN